MWQTAVARSIVNVQGSSACSVSFQFDQSACTQTLQIDIMASVKAVKLPRYVIFKGDNGFNLCHKWLNPNHRPYLQFNSTSRNTEAIHEVYEMPGMENVVAILSWGLESTGGWWTRTPQYPYWIWANTEARPTPNDLDCLFKVVQIGPNTVGLQCLADGMYLKRLTDQKESCLSSKSKNCFNEHYAQLEVSEAVIARRVFEVEYLVKDMQTSEMKPIFLYNSKATNDTQNKNVDLSMTASYEEEKQNSWSNSVTFTAGVATAFQAGIPLLADGKIEVSAETSFSTEFGKVDMTRKSVSCTLTVKDVAPGETVYIVVKGNKATGTVPFKYKYQDTAADGMLKEVQTGEDGIFVGVHVVDVKWEVTNSRGAPKQVIVEDK
ncbi:hypothetical protein M758_12G133000 [Ceratodon purpureus]|nr:hypothetical protein M758_12G133000 [Ceratodon purpureus]